MLTQFDFNEELTLVDCGRAEHLSNTTWSEIEDRKLVELYEQLKDRYDLKTIWIEIAKCFPGKTSDNCRKRWRSKIDPSATKLKRDKWSVEEDDMILKLHSRIGNKWTKLAKMINKNKSDIEIKNRYFYLQKKAKSDEELLRCFESVRTGNIISPNKCAIQYVGLQSNYDIVTHNATEYKNENFTNIPKQIDIFPQIRKTNDKKSYIEIMDSLRPTGIAISKRPYFLLDNHVSNNSSACYGTEIKTNTSNERQANEDSAFWNESVLSHNQNQNQNPFQLQNLDISKKRKVDLPY